VGCHLYGLRTHSRNTVMRVLQQSAILWVNVIEFRTWRDHRTRVTTITVTASFLHCIAAIWLVTQCFFPVISGNCVTRRELRDDDLCWPNRKLLQKHEFALTFGFSYWPISDFEENISTLFLEIKSNAERYRSFEWSHLMDFVNPHTRNFHFLGCNDTFSNDTIHISIQGQRYDTLLCATQLVTNNLDNFK